MKTTQLLLSGFFSLLVTHMSAQNVESSSSRTSGGLEAGGSSSGTGNTFYGYRTGKVTNSTGIKNTFVGHAAGAENTSGSYNIFMGANAGEQNTTGNSNIFIGNYAGGESFSGNSNVIIGGSAGSYGNGSGNIFIGSAAGETETGSNKLFIANSEDETPLIWGDFATDQLKFNATKVGIGSITTFPTTSAGVSLTNYKLFVKGGILADEVRVSTTWSDYVFESGYKLPTLEEVEKHIKEKGHLINVPSGKQVEADGIEVGQMAKIQQEKIEELTLYIIEQNKINEQQRQQLEKQGREIQQMKAMLLTLVKK